MEENKNIHICEQLKRSITMLRQNGEYRLADMEMIAEAYSGIIAAKNELEEEESITENLNSAIYVIDMYLFYLKLFIKED